MVVVRPSLRGARYNGVLWWAVTGDAPHDVGAQALPRTTVWLEKHVRNVVRDSGEVWRGDGGSAGEGEGGGGGRVIGRRGGRERASAFRVVVSGPEYWSGGGSEGRMGDEGLGREERRGERCVLIRTETTLASSISGSNNNCILEAIFFIISGRPIIGAKPEWWKVQLKE